MGGFNVQTADGKSYRLNPLQLIALLREGMVPVPDITLRDIKDKSKLDTFAKAVVGAQILWFVVSLSARANQHLAISPLEHFTLSVVCCSLVSFLAWLKKPKDIGEATNIKSDLKLSELLPILEEHKETFRYSGHRVMFHEAIRRQHTTMSPYLLNLAALPICSAFGISHILAWNYSFPTETEKLLWRVASIGVFTLPLLLLGATVVATHLDKKSTSYGEENSKMPMYDVALIALFFLYAIFRVYAFIEVFACLRSSPMGTYDDIIWTKYLPHFGG